MSSWSPPPSWLVPPRSRSNSSHSSAISLVSLSGGGERQPLLSEPPSTPSYSEPKPEPLEVAEACPATGGEHEPRSRAEEMSLLLSHVSFTLVPLGLLTYVHPTPS